MRIRLNTDKYLNNRDWQNLAKHFEGTCQQVLGDDGKPIEFESVEAHAEYLEKVFTESAEANQGFVERMEREEFDNIIDEYEANL